MYLNVTEIESALTGLKSGYPALCDLIELPNKTFEGRTSHALRIGKTRPAAGGVLFAAATHAREWGGPDAVVSFAADLLEAYQAGKGLQYGANVYSAQQVKDVMEALTVFVLPCVNPDGYNHSLTGTAWADVNWRKNRNPASASGIPGRVGVDTNRNHDFLWDFRKRFHPAANMDSLASDDPASDLFHGVGPASEPEVRNIRWLLDTYPEIRFYTDIHSYNGTVLYSWGDDGNQTANPGMSFLNAAFDGQRGLDGDAYREYIPNGDLAVGQQLATRMTSAMNAVRGLGYEARQSFDLDVGTGKPYPTSGASDDYAYSRHYSDPSLAKIHAFTLEFGKGSDGGFFPTWTQAQPRILEVDAAMIALCVGAIPIVRPRIVPNIWEVFIALIGGVEQGGGGFGILPGGRKVPIPPHEPFVLDVVPLLAALEALSYGDREAVAKARRELLRAIANLANRSAGRG